MARIGVETIRRQQLIDATLKVIEEHGFQGATVGKIAALAGLSVGIVSHYFGGKQGLLEATMRHLLSSLQQDVSKLMADRPNTPRERLMAIVDANFSGVQTHAQSSKTWLAFWTQAMHSPDLMRLQRVNERRLLSNLMFYLRELMPEPQVRSTAQTIAALIDGFWLRAAMSEGRIEPSQAVTLCKTYIDQAIQANNGAS
ncbi:transcriptional regulator BetI [Marinobacter litoralis]|uniref:transcriptional regulator BetI n=1 Tax=Marinobacter litoralis TaxID=187981 RepID=UPI0018EBA204|nr:transcriptional regulator BetI [Marinobacter litoralis]MBJ6138331.1 transcriptional regulator BetI [Marinobacter litoralis]